MENLWIQHNNIYIVPVLRQRLNFAVVVQNAAHRLQLDGQDLIAVELPASALQKMKEAIEHLPRVSLVIASVSGQDQREVFPVTPCDAVVEAIRISIERGLPLECIDREIAPAHLWQRHCLQDADWPDDGLVLERGVDAYMRLIQDRIAHPPARIEPVDTWRDTFMAQRLRMLHPLYRRILFVCDAAHVDPIRELLRTPLRFKESTVEVGPVPRLEIRQPNLDVLLRQLDDIPWVVEAYEKARAEEKGRGFRKHVAVLEAARAVDGAEPQLSFGVRHYQAFARFLQNLLEYHHQISPTLEQTVISAASCFDKPFGKRLRRRLLSYAGQVRVERVGVCLTTGDEIHAPETEGSNGRSLYVARACNARQQAYHILPVVVSRPALSVQRPSATGPSDESYDRWVWPPWRNFFDRERDKAHLLAERSQQRIRSVAFGGSLEHGVDVRRTLRSSMGPDPHTYVKIRSGRGRTTIDRREPVVWLFGPAGSDAKFSSTWFGIPISQLRSWTFTEWTPLVEDKNARSGVGKFYLSGIAAFCKFGLNENIYELYGDQLDLRLPSYAEVVKTEGLGWDWPRLTQGIGSGRPWWQLLVIAGIQYAKRDIICVLSQEFDIPRDIFRLAASQGKTIHSVPLSLFDQDEQRKLRDQYHVWAPFGFRKYDPPVIEPALLNRFSDTMKQYWAD